MNRLYRYSLIKLLTSYCQIYIYIYIYIYICRQEFSQHINKSAGPPACRSCCAVPTLRQGESAEVAAVDAEDERQSL